MLAIKFTYILRYEIIISDGDKRASSLSFTNVDNIVDSYIKVASCKSQVSKIIPTLHVF